MDSPVVMTDPVAQLQQKRNGELGDGGGAVAGNIAYRDAAGFGGIAVYDVVTGGGNSNKPDIGAGVQYGLGDGCFVWNDNFCGANVVNDLFFADGLTVDDGFAQRLYGRPA